eukprot:scaffold7608_cov62-Phaeocystis_antarctica.AAC.2
MSAMTAPSTFFGPLAHSAHSTHSTHSTNSTNSTNSTRTHTNWCSRHTPRPLIARSICNLAPVTGTARTRTKRAHALRPCKSGDYEGLGRLG